MKKNTKNSLKAIIFRIFVLIVGMLLQFGWTYILGTYVSEYIFVQDSRMLGLALFSFIMLPAFVFSLMYCCLSKGQGQGQGLLFFWIGISIVAVKSLSVNMATVMLICFTVLAVGIIAVKIAKKELADDYKQII